MSNGYTLVETSVAVTIALIIFGSSIEFIRFADRFLSKSVRMTVTSLDMTLVSQRIANDLRNARQIDAADSTWTIWSQNNRVVRYEQTDGQLIRNGRIMSASVAFDSLKIRIRSWDRRDFADYRVFATVSGDTSSAFRISSGVRIRGAPVWVEDIP